MLILAGVTIATLTGDNGIITQANKTRVEQSHATVKEATTLAYNEHQIEMETVENTTTNFLDYLIGKGYVDATTKIVDAEKLIGTKQALGNGKGDDDVYKVEQEKGGYILKYYENSTEKTILWQAETFSDEEIFVYDETEEGIEIIGLDFSKLKYEEGAVDYGIYGEDTDVTEIKNLQTLKIPSTINGKNVVSVKLLGLRNNNSNIHSSITGIEKIICPETVKKIGGNSDSKKYYRTYMLSVKNIELNEGLEEIDYNAFSGMVNLEEITIPSSVKKIDSRAFYGRTWDSEESIIVNVKEKDSAEDFEEPLNLESYYGTVTVNYLGK